MAMIVTLALHVKDWRALRDLNRETLIRRAREAGAVRYRLLRNASDASQALLVAELPDDQSAEELERDLATELTVLPGGCAADEQVWETTELEGIG